MKRFLCITALLLAYNATTGEVIADRYPASPL
jgi:hypothetical protein